MRARCACCGQFAPANQTKCAACTDCIVDETTGQGIVWQHGERCPRRLAQGRPRRLEAAAAG